MNSQELALKRHRKAMRRQRVLSGTVKRKKAKKLVRRVKEPLPWCCDWPYQIARDFGVTLDDQIHRDAPQFIRP